MQPVLGKIYIHSYLVPEAEHERDVILPWFQYCQVGHLLSHKRQRQHVGIERTSLGSHGNWDHFDVQNQGDTNLKQPEITDQVQTKWEKGTILHSSE